MWRFAHAHRLPNATVRYRDQARICRVSLVLVQCKLRNQYGPSQPQAGSELDAESLQEARDSDYGKAIRTVQQWLGHSDMESTMRYLKPSRSEKVREKVNEIFA